MQKISRSAVTELLDPNRKPSQKVTIYIPMETTASPPHITENQIRFKNMIHASCEELKRSGHNGGLSEQLTELLETYYDDIEFWKFQSRALLICAEPGMARMFSLPVDTEEYIALDGTYHLAPVLALIGDDREFYVLALAQQHPKLFRGDMYGLEPTDIELPESLQRAIGIDELNQGLESQGSAIGSSMQTGGFNGRGGAHDLDQSDRLRFFHMVDKALVQKTDHSLPLILAGTDSEIAEFRGVSKYPIILRGTIAGNHVASRMVEIFVKAQGIIQKELIHPNHVSVREEYDRVSGANPGRVAASETSIVAAADQGRVDKLLATMGRRTTDTVQDKVESVLRITFSDNDHSKLLNRLAAKVWQMSGKVISLLPHETPLDMQNGAPMVARLRF